MADSILNPVQPDQGSSMQSTAGTGQALQQAQGSAGLPTPTRSVSTAAPGPNLNQASYTQDLKGATAYNNALTAAGSTAAPLDLSKYNTPGQVVQSGSGFQVNPNTTGNTNQQTTQAQAQQIANTSGQVQGTPTAPAKDTGNVTPPAASNPNDPYATGDAKIDGQIAANNTVANTYIDQSKALQQNQLTDQATLQQTLVKNAQDSYQAQQANLATLSDQAAQSLAAKNQAAADEATAQEKNFQLQFQRDQQELEDQRARSNEAYQNQIVTQNVANTQRTLQEESSIAALGGFGNLTQHRELQFLTLQNDRVMNQIVFQKDQADRETTQHIQQVSDQYTANINQVEADKEKNIADNYDSYLSFIKGVQEDKNLTEEQKVQHLDNAANNYTKNVAEINNNALQARYNVSDKAATTARQIFQQNIENQRANIQTTTYTDNKGNVTSVSIDTRTGKQVTSVDLGKIGAALAYQVSFDPYTGVGSVINPADGSVVSLGTGSNAMNYFNNTPAGYSHVGGSLMTNDSLTSIFNIGQKGVGDGSPNDGQCGHTYNALTDGPKVGDTWDSKIGKATIKPTVADGKNVAIQPGMGLALPLLVKTDGTGTGHMETVLDYDPATGIMHTIESNLDGKGTTQTQTRNILELEKNYKNPDGSSNFGFLPSTFKSGIQNKISSATIPYAPGGQQNNAVPTGQMDLPGTNPQAIAGATPYIQNTIRLIDQGQMTVQQAAQSGKGIDSNWLLQQVKAYDPSYNEMLRTANSGLIAPALSTLYTLKASEGAASASLDQLSSAHSKLPVTGKITALNDLLQKFEGGMSSPDVAQFRAAASDALGQVGLNITGGTAVSQGLGMALESGLGSGLDQAAFDKAIQAIKNTMANKVNAQSDVVNLILAGKNAGEPTPTTQTVTPTTSTVNPLINHSIL